MGAKKNIITINGRTYDTVTGRILETEIATKAPAKTSPTSKAESKLQAGTVIKPQPKTHAAAPTPMAAKSPAAKTPSKPKKIAVTQHAERDPGQRAHKIHVKTQRAKTLVRNGLAKPTSTKKTIAVTGLAKQPSHQVIIGRASTRSETASRNLKSKHISKFNHGPQVTHRTADMPVKAAPTARASQKQQYTSYNIRDTPPTLPAHHTKTSHSPATNIFEDALAAATSHKTSHTSKRKGHRLRQAGVLAASIVVLGGFFAYQNAPRIALYSASSKIGFKAALPGYQPSGFGLSGAVQYQQGLVLANYRSNTDDRAYTIAQTKYELDDSSLTAGLAAEQKAFQTEVVAGRPVYILSNGVTWIENGVRYIVEGNAGLTKEQLTKIAASI